MLRVIFVAALALRLVVDMATPLLPGAYHFNPAESIEAHRTPTLTTAHGVTRPTALPRPITHQVETGEPEIRRVVTPIAWRRELRPVTPPGTRDRAQEAPEDH